MKEFGTWNKHGHLNCFINVCLQALWQFPTSRFIIKQTVERYPSLKRYGSDQLQPFFEALLEFYDQAFRQDSTSNEVPILQNSGVRTKFALLFYQ